VNAHSRIVIACPNLSLDRTIKVEATALGKVHRSIASDVHGGGKGVNVARALKCMERDSLVIGVSAGRTGDAVLGLLEDEGVEVVAVDAPGETRSCLTVLSEESPTVFNESGPIIHDGVWSRYERSVLDNLRSGDLFVFSGSLPLGAPRTAAAGLVAGARERGCSTICDTSHPYLGAALAAQPDIIKPNLHEALALLGQDNDETVDFSSDALDRAEEAARRLLDQGPLTVIVTVGAAGLVHATESRTQVVEAPKVKVLNPVGAGDCFIAGVAMHLAVDALLDEAVLFGTAMGAAGCETFAAGLVDPSRVQELRAEISAGSARGRSAEPTGPCGSVGPR